MKADSLQVPEYFKEKVKRVFGADGEAWLERLPGLIEGLVAKWRLTCCRTGEDLSIHYICYARSPEFGEVVLKTGVPHLELYSGMDALTLFGGRHACRLYEIDRECGAMLLERILPGSRLKDEQGFRLRLEIGASLAASLPVEVPEPCGFPSFKGQMDKAFSRARLEGRADSRFISMLEVAERLHEGIKGRNKAKEKVLLHGDLHHENILRDAAGGWKAIDPQGRTGERCLEAGRFLLNEWQWFGGIGDHGRMQESMGVFADALGEDLETIAASCFLDCALSRCWSLEEGCGQEVIGLAIREMEALLEFLG